MYLSSTQKVRTHQPSPESTGGGFRTFKPRLRPEMIGMRGLLRPRRLFSLACRRENQTIAGSLTHDTVWDGKVAPRATLEIPRRIDPAALEMLITSGVFGAGVTVDLPDPARFTSLPPATGTLPIVSTTAACRWNAPTGSLTQRIGDCLKAGDKAWLLVGGDQKSWRNPSPKRPDVFGLLDVAMRMRRQSKREDPPKIWCVINPLVEDTSREAARLAEKFAHGAELVVTQPLLLRNRVEQFWAETEREGLAHKPKLVGIAVPSSMTSLGKWLKICGVSEQDGEAEALVGRWQAARDEGEEAFNQFRMAELVEALRFARSLSGVVGVHLIPIEDGGVRDLLEFISQRRRDYPDEPPI